MIVPVVGLLVFAAVFVLIWQIFPDPARIQAMRRARAREVRVKLPVLLKVTLPILVLLLPFAEMIPAKRWRRSTAVGLKRAGMHGLVSVDEVLALKLFLSLFLPGMMMLYVAIIPWPVIVVMAVFGFFFTELWLRDQAKHRQLKITRQLPFVLDLLTLTVEAGLDFTPAMARVVERLPPSPIKEEFELTVNEFRIGASKADALRNLSERVETREMTSVTSALIQSAEIGASVGTTLRQVSEIMRANRFQKAERVGAESSQKMLIPLVIFLMPAFLIVVLGPVLLRYVYGTGF